jgi:Glycosyl transferase family 2
MRTAVITFTYNEAVNLPIWLRHYGTNFGEANLFIADRGSNDGSLGAIGEANLLRLPRDSFDEYQKTDFISSFHRSLLNFYDAVIITDCDELLVADPQKYQNLRHYMETTSHDYVSGLGLEVLHIINAELPIDLSKPILSQRRYANFYSAGCKCLISRVPTIWLPGFHSCNHVPRIDPDLYMIHTKLMDYGAAMNRQQVNIDTKWSQRSLEQNLGAHHRFDFKTFVHQCFLVPIDAINRGLISPFTFAAEISEIQSRTTEHEGYYHIPMNLSKLVELPDRLHPLV